MRIHLSALLPAPPEAVWSQLVDWERQAEWMPDVAWIRRLGAEDGVGLRLAARTKVFGIPMVTDELRVTVWEPPVRLAVEHTGFVKGRAEWRLEPSGPSTRFAWTEDLHMPPPGLGELALFAYRPVLTWTFRRSMRNLARRL